MGAHAEITHRLARRSWWDGSVIARCGQRFSPGYYRELVLDLSPVTCPGCRRRD